MSENHFWEVSGSLPTIPPSSPSLSHSFPPNPLPESELPNPIEPNITFDDYDRGRATIEKNSK